MARRAQTFPPALTHAAHVLAQWRRQRTQRRIPDRLWQQAVALARTYGVHQTSHALRLEYAGLKRRVAAAGGARPDSPSPSFVEVLPLPGGLECVVEFERPDGGKMRIHHKGAGAPDWASLSQAFWGAGA